MHAPTMKKMLPRRNPLLLLLPISALIVLALACPASCAKPVLFPVAKDAATSLYTIPIRDGASHVIDLAGPLLWSTCDHIPAEISCADPRCTLANEYLAPSCRGIAGKKCSKRCVAYPYNPVTGRCAAAELVHTRLVANTTDGRNPLYQASLPAVAACPPTSAALLDRLPRDATGVAGMSAAGLALPTQIAKSQRVANAFLLCLPRSGHGEGVAVFGSRGPFFLKLFLTGDPSSADLTSTLQLTPLHSRPGNPLYYIPVTGVTVGRAPVPVRLGVGGVVLCTRVPYTLLRHDVYRPVVAAFEKGLIRKDMRVAAVPPFEFCYNRTLLPPTRLGYGVPEITLVLDGHDGGKKEWTFVGSNSMVDVNANTACLAFVEMKGVKPDDPAAAAIVVGGFQMEDHLLQFDLEKKQLGFAKVPVISACTNFNFTRGQY